VPEFGVLGEMGVSVFFALSGYLISKPFIEALAAGRPLPELLPYALRRAARIFPAYWVFFGLSAAVFLASPARLPSDQFLLGSSPLGVGDWIAGSTMVPLIAGSRSLVFVPQGWTLAIEMVFYAMVPVVAAMTLLTSHRRPVSRRTLALVVVGLWLCSLVAYYIIGDPSLKGVFTVRPRYAALYFLAFSGLFAPGVLAAVAGASGPLHGATTPKSRGLPRVWLWLVGAAVLIGCLWCATALLPLPPAIGAWRREPEALAAGLILAAVLSAAAHETSVLTKLLSRVGTVSYSLYLCHWAVVRQLALHDISPTHVLPGWLGLPAGLLLVGIISTGIAAMGYWCVEKPAMKWAKRRADHLRRRRSSQPAQEVAQPVTQPGGA
jgi:peptidoglycan/LPS O-acetylase OafA/YrhL